MFSVGLARVSAKLMSPGGGGGDSNIKVTGGDHRTF